MIVRRKWLKRGWLQKKARRRRELWRSGRVMEDAAGMAVLREAAYDRAEGNCDICGLPAPWEGFNKGELIHVLARGRGGSDVLGNVQWGHRKCHTDRDHPGPQWRSNENTLEQ